MLGESICRFAARGCLALLLAAAPLHAVIITSSVNPTADALVTTGSNGSFSGNNYGGAGALGIAAAGSAKGEFQTFMLFSSSSSVSSFNSTFGAGQWTISSLTLTLTATSPNNAIFNASAAGAFEIDWLANDSWAEGTGNPGNPTADGITYTSSSGFLTGAESVSGSLSFTGGTSGSLTFTLTPTADLLNDIMAGGNVGFRFYAADSNIAYLFNSRSFGTVSARPTLTLTAVPEPSAGLLCLSGGLIALAVRRRRRA